MIFSSASTAAAAAFPQNAAKSVLPLLKALATGPVFLAPKLGTRNAKLSTRKSTILVLLSCSVRPAAVTHAWICFKSAFAASRVRHSTSKSSA